MMQNHKVIHGQLRLRIKRGSELRDPTTYEKDKESPAVTGTLIAKLLLFQYIQISIIEG